MENFTKKIKEKKMKKLGPNNTQIAVNKIEKAKEYLEKAIELMEDVANRTKDEYAKSYMIDHLKIMANRNHGFMARDFNCDEWISKLEGREYDEEENW